MADCGRRGRRQTGRKEREAGFFFHEIISSFRLELAFLEFFFFFFGLASSTSQFCETRRNESNRIIAAN